MKPKICQSCGMPIYLSEQLGSDSMGLNVDDYCAFCYKEGEFTSDVTMEEMIELCSKYMNDMPKEQAILLLKKKYPTLKRWAQKEDTQNEYHKSINLVLDYINQNLKETPDLDKLSQIANISAFHFHRIFKAIIGENIGEYVQRLKLEYAAGQLVTTDLTLDEIAEKTGYNSLHSLSKAFKKHFSVSPTRYKLNFEQLSSNNNPSIPQVKINRILPIHVMYIRIIGEYGSAELYSNAWKKLYSHALSNSLIDDSSLSLGLSLDDPSITDKHKCRFYACVSVKHKTKAAGEFGSKTIPEGLYAIFTNKGSYKHLHQLYKDIWFNWLPNSCYQIRKGIHFEKYLNNPHLVDEKDILTEIYIPIKSKKA